METDNNIVYTEVQKLDKNKWILRPIIIAFSLLVLLMAIPMLYFYFTGGASAMQEIFNVPFIVVTLIGGLIPCCIIYFARTRMKLEIFVTKPGLKYTFRSASVKEKFIPWNEVNSVEIKKYPFTATRPGNQKAIWLNGQDAFIMTVDMIGIEIKFKNGKFAFLTSTDPDSLIRAIKTCNDNNIEVKK